LWATGGFLIRAGKKEGGKGEKKRKGKEDPKAILFPPSKREEIPSIEKKEKKGKTQ